jgi:hypothetical protein
LHITFKARLASKLEIASEPIAFKTLLAKSSSLLKIIQASNQNDIRVSLRNKNQKFYFVKFAIKFFSD